MSCSDSRTWTPWSFSCGFISLLFLSMWSVPPSQSCQFRDRGKLAQYDTNGGRGKKVWGDYGMGWDGHKLLLEAWKHETFPSGTFEVLLLFLGRRHTGGLLRSARN